jgi:hypothetical protein
MIAYSVDIKMNDDDMILHESHSYARNGKFLVVKEKLECRSTQKAASTSGGNDRTCIRRLPVSKSSCSAD